MAIIGSQSGAAGPEGAVLGLLAGAKMEFFSSYGPEIRKNVTRSGMSDVLKAQLLCMIPLDSSERQSLLETPGLPLFARARLGDQDAEKLLIEAYDRETDYRKKCELVGELSKAGTPGTLKHLVVGFNEPVYTPSALTGKTRGGPCPESIRYHIITEMARHHPENALLTDTLDSFMDREIRDQRIDKARITSYLAEVQSYLEAVYGVRAKDPTPLPVIQIPCVIP